MSSPLVSIITPNFNKGEFVSACIRSVQNQTYSNWEMLVIDDGSTDGSDKLAAEIAKNDDRITFDYNNRTKGASVCRNLGLSLAKGEWVIFLDSDDILSSDCLDRRIKILQQNPDLDYAVFPMGLFHKEIGDSDIICNIPTKEDPLHRFLNRDIAWLIAGPIWKRSILEELKGFDESLHSQQDYDLHVRALIGSYAYRYFHVSPDVFYRQEVHSLPRLNSQTVEHFQFRYEMVLRHYDLLKGADKLGEQEKILLARYILDLAQMMRWHLKELGIEARKRGLKYWKSAFDRGLVSESQYHLGVKYIRFKHNMRWNRLRLAKVRLEKYFRNRLGSLIFYPSKTYCKVKLTDYEI